LLPSFYTSIAVTHGLSWLLLAMTSAIVPRVCRERPAGSRGSRWLEIRNRWSYGKASRRRAFRKRLLDKNAFYWLAARDRIKANYVWSFLGFVLLLWCWASLALTNFLFDWDISLILIFFCFVFLKIWLASEVCARLVEDRSCGAFELLLSSPLALNGIARGQFLALWRQFGKPASLLLVLSSVLLLIALRSPHEGFTAMELIILFSSVAIIFVADLITLKWLATWQALTSSQVSYALVATCGRALLLPTVLFLLCYAVFWLIGQAGGWTPGAEGTRGEVCILWLVVGLTTDAFFAVRARWLFYHQFREVASERFVPARAGLAPFAELWRALRQRVTLKSTRASPAAAPRTLSWTGWLVVGPALAVIVGVLSFALWRHMLTRRVESRLAAIHAGGLPVTTSDLNAWVPAVPDEQNAGLLLQKAIPYFWSTKSSAPQMVFGRTRVEWPGPAAPLTPQFRADLSNFVASCRQGMDLAERAVYLGKSRFPIEWGLRQSRSMTPAMNLFRLRQLNPLFQAQGLLALEDGDMEKAHHTIMVLLGLAHILEQEPFEIAQRFRLGALQDASRVLERALNQHPFSLDQLRSMDQMLADAELATGPALVRTAVAERCLQLDDMRLPRSTASGLPPGAAQGMALTLGTWARSFVGARDRELLDYLSMMDEFMQRFQKFNSSETDALSAPAARPVSGAKGQGQGDLFSFRMHWEEFLESQMEIKVRLRVGRTALAIERYRAEHGGSLPANLSDLVPQFLPDLSKDPFDSGILRFKAAPEGYVIYSIGKDRKDNGGNDGPFVGRNEGYDLSFTVHRSRGAASNGN
jgi:hypothetical protein